MKKSIHYKDAGVDIEAGIEAVNRIRGMVRSTFTPGVLTDIGKFGGFFQLDLSAYTEPVLVSSIDGVGTKLKVAFMTGKHDSIGEDLVNHCVNDIFVGGAKPLFFLDYIGTGKLSPSVIEEIIAGMVRGCRNVGCALVGGEMAEMPGFYQKGEYDVAGSIVGVVEKSRIVDGSSIRKGDVLIGLPSNGLHTNGYSLARKVLFENSQYQINTHIDELGTTIGEVLLRVHRCYLPIVKPLLDRFEIKGMSHITGGGIVGNTMRIVPEGLKLKIDWSGWKRPPIFKLIQKSGNVPEEEMRKTFNLGIGYILIVPKIQTEDVLNALESQSEKPVIMGEVV
jgi:phosphoribosylformylglycinamidine cyclo-ligase